MNHTIKQSRRRRALAFAAMAVIGSSPLTLSPSAEASPLGELNGATSSAAATTMSLPFGMWTEFEFGRGGSTVGVFTFFSDTPVLLRVTDGFCRGDAFRGSDRGFALFNTSSVGTDPSCDDEPNVGTGGAAWADPNYSKGRFLLQPGQHQVRIRITASPFGAGGAFLRIDKRPVT